MSDIWDEIETALCDHCNKRVPIEDTESLGDDCRFCVDCAAEWRREFHACSHDWEPQTIYDDWGDAGRFCTRCGGFVTHDAAMEMFPFVCDGWVASA